MAAGNLAVHGVRCGAHVALVAPSFALSELPDIFIHNISQLINPKGLAQVLRILVFIVVL